MPIYKAFDEFDFIFIASVVLIEQKRIADLQIADPLFLLIGEID